MLKHNHKYNTKKFDQKIKPDGVDFTDLWLCVPATEETEESTSIKSVQIENKSDVQQPKQQKQQQ